MSDRQGEKAWMFREVMCLEAQILEHKRILSWPCCVCKKDSLEVCGICVEYELVLMECRSCKSAPKLFKFSVHTIQADCRWTLHSSNGWKREKARRREPAFRTHKIGRSWSGVLNCDIVMPSSSRSNSSTASFSSPWHAFYMDNCCAGTPSVDCASFFRTWESLDLGVCVYLNHYQSP
jgi:hypothetical protein